ncbi:MAG TPA: M23 family metallopeptidase [Bacillota bacterium]|jgi:murein DD-endopeptidase MepM/ murein hydrolase activator NlpD
MLVVKPGAGAVSNGKPVLFDAPPEARGGHVWGELAPVLRALGHAVSWSPLSGRLIAVPCRPVSPLEGELVVTSPYGPRIYNGRLFHSGVDLKASMGTDVYSVADGQVSWVGYDPKGFGRYVLVNHGEFTSIYAHLSRTDVVKGLAAGAGQRLGLSGGVGPDRGDSDGPHLHWGIYVGPMILPSGKFDPAATVDPMQFLERG